MSIVAAELWQVSFALPVAHVAAHGATAVREVAVLALTADDGTVGWGECDALSHAGYGGATLGQAWDVLREQLLPALLRGGAGTSRDHPLASAAVAAAMLDIDARRSGVSIAEALGGVQRRVQSRAVIGIADSVDLLLADVAAALESGFRHVKLKVQPGWDVMPVRAVRGCWPTVGLAVDANGSYDEQSAGDVLAALADAALAYVEQPLQPTDLDALARLARSVDVPLALDESVSSAADLRSAHACNAGSILNVKPARLGGPREAAALARAAADLGWTCFAGGMLEAGVGRATALAVASLSACQLPTDLGPTSRYIEHDILPSVELAGDGTLEVPPGVGLGAVPSRARLAELSLATWSTGL